MTPGRQQAQQQASQELAQGKYHVQPTSPSPTPSTSSPTPTVSTPSPTPTSTASHHSSGTTILLVILLIVVVGIAILLVLRKIGKPRKDENAKKDKGKHLAGGSAETPLFGAALHRHNAEQAAKGGNWQEAIRERFRAVIAVLDERSLLPERKDRTADEAARDAGELLPEHAEALRDAARAFDEVEYGEYLGTPEGYGVISAVDDAIGSAVRA
ncbi:DUF4129 domain-containing protein [Actinospica sp. MGRD01-02]|uniref:DUF4129 domain-containing protein n=1 Tax=Actinospica acidithermotolerans TaxID=2828514 RepID=A0A941EBH6_9ACTN|nr:DUF4129 domain-containing protein [Actinospica acidithermotolerans]MBR7827403.1 DUF4129 domain-containing protein [Actinospica acidithermotolerans]